jgi:replication-associated recombination protein RarA
LGHGFGEDVGLAEPNAPAVVAGLWQMSEVLRAKGPTREPGAKTIYPWLQLEQAAWYLARLPKNRELADADTLIALQRKRGETREIPAYARDKHTASGRAMGKGIYHFDGGTGAEFGRFIENAVEVDGDQWRARFYQAWTAPADRSSRELE